MSIYISGSLAYDRIMNFPGVFSECILPDKIHMLNAVFTIDNLQQKRGGTGGNIAYNLSLLGEKPLLLSCAGTDFESYAVYLESLGLSLRYVRRVPNEFTAGAYIITDRASSQIIAFHAAAMNYSCDYDFCDLNPSTDWGIVSPTNPDDMYSHPMVYKSKGVRYIFDPGQQISALDPGRLLEALDGSYALAGNDYEISLICERAGISRADLQRKTGALITTLGKHGSDVSFPDGTETHVPAVPGLNALDPTGAGDAYRAGLLKGLSVGFDIVESSKLGSICASFCVEKYGTQEHSFGTRIFGERYKATFGSTLPAAFKCARD